MKIQYKKSFAKSFRKLSKPLQQKTKDVVNVFHKDPQASTLRNHALQGNLKGLRSLDVTGDLRIIFRELSGGTYELVEMLEIGTHAQLYR